MTVAELVEGALRKIGVMDAGDTVAAPTKVAGMTALNRLLSAWSNEPATSILTTDSKALTGPTSYSIGPTGEIVTVRPSVVVDAYFVDGNNSDYALQPISMQDYYAIADKTTVGIPTRYAYDPQFPDAEIYLYPAPDSGTLKVISRKPLEQYSNLTDSVTLPVEYHAALEWNLAVALAPEFGQEPSQVVVSMATATYDGLKKVLRQPVAIADTTPFQNRRFSWM